METSKIWVLTEPRLFDGLSLVHERVRTAQNPEKCLAFWLFQLIGKSDLLFYKCHFILITSCKLISFYRNDFIIGPRPHRGRNRNPAISGGLRQAGVWTRVSNVEMVSDTRKASTDLLNEIEFITLNGDVI
jgi:hypothetical protein